MNEKNSDEEFRVKKVSGWNFWAMQGGIKSFYLRKILLKLFSLEG